MIAPEFSTDHEFRRRFRREFRATASIQHPNVIPIYHAGEEDGLLYVTMRYVDGTDLARLLAAEKSLEPQRRRATSIAQVADALDAAHQAGIVHRDVKPANVLLEATRRRLPRHADRLRADEEPEVADPDHAGRDDHRHLRLRRARAAQGDRDRRPRGRLRARRRALPGAQRQGPVPARDRRGDDARPPRLAAAVAALRPARPRASSLGAVVRRAMAKDPADRFPSRRRPRPRRARRRSTRGVTQPPERSVATGDASPHAKPRSSRSRSRPRLAVETGLGEFVGRADHLARLESRYAAAEAGQRQFVLLVGRARDRQDAPGHRARPPRPPGGRDRALRPLATPSRSSPTSRSSPRSATTSTTASSSTCRRSSTLELSELARFVPGAAQARPRAARSRSPRSPRRAATGSSRASRGCSRSPPASARWC